MTGRFFIFILFAALVLTNGTAFAQVLGEPAATTLRPVCFDVRNDAPYSILGTFVTNSYQDPKTGQTVRHHENFRLESKKFIKVCSTGPFFPGQKLDLQLRTFFPVFECRTGTDGPLIIHGEQHDDGTIKSWADCR
jgi:hypothetical protein